MSTDATAAPEVVEDTEEARQQAVSDAAAAEMEAEEAQAQAVPASMVEDEPAATRRRHGHVYLCERGHRTDAIWSTPSVCHARPLRHGAECGRPLYPIADLPEQVQKALNPLKASKKASKK